MGGTEINGALRFCYNSKPRPHTPKLIYLLTDGDVSNPDSVITLAK